MTVGWFRSLTGDEPAAPTGGASYFECSNCASAFDDWPGSCPRCDQLVVRVVERRPVTAR